MSKGHRVLVTNPGGERIVLNGKAKYYEIIPVGKNLFEVHYGGKYLGESESLSGAEKFISRGGASAPVLIKNPNGGYEMYKYSTPKSNPPKKKKAKKKATKKKSTKKKSTKKKATKSAPKKKLSSGQIDKAVRAHVEKKSGKKAGW